MSVLATDLLPDDLWRITPLPGAATKTPTAETTLPQALILMPTDDRRTIVLPGEISHPGKAAIREKGILASMSEVAAATGK